MFWSFCSSEHLLSMPVQGLNINSEVCQQKASVDCMSPPCATSLSFHVIHHHVIIECLTVCCVTAVLYVGLQGLAPQQQNSQTG